MNQRSDAIQRFAVGRGMWGMTAVIYAFFALGVVLVIADLFSPSDPAGAVFGAVWATGIIVSGLWIVLAEPRRVECCREGSDSSPPLGRSSSRGPS